MSIRVPRASLVATVFALVLAAVIGTSSPVRAHGQFTKAPGFRAVDLAGERFALDDLLGRGPIVVSFWATSSKESIQRMPHIQRLHDEYEKAGARVLAVAIDSPQAQSRVQRFVKSRNFDACVVMDAERDVLRKLGGTGSVPYVVVLDDHGYVRYRHAGYHPGDEKELTRVVKDLLAEAERGEGPRFVASHCQRCHGPAGMGDERFAKHRVS
jgi:peroxiredoxin